MEEPKDFHENVISHIKEQNENLKSDKKLFSCDLCGWLSNRCVGLPCCPTIGCRKCFVKNIEEHHKCWSCDGPLETDKIIIKEEVRKWITGIQRKTGFSIFLGEEDRRKFAEWKSPLDDWRSRREEKIRREDAEDYKNFKIPHQPRSNFERIIQAKQAFQNVTSVHTGINLSFHGFRRFGGEKRKQYDRKMLPLRLRGSFTLDGGHLKPRPGYGKVLCSKDEVKDLDCILSNSDEDDKTVPFSSIPLKLKRILFESIKPKFGKNYSKYADDKSELVRLIRDFTDSFAENLEFQVLVNNNNLSLTQGKLQEIIDTEQQLRSYQDIYSETDMAFCNKCKVKHWFL